MKTLYRICLLTLFISACREPENLLLSGYLNTGKLPSQSFTIDPDHDTTLVTDGGVRIHITKGSFEGDKPVAIEWKEALDFQSMLKAGLLTKSGKSILRSGGMFYFNTKEKLTMQKPIGIDVRAETIVSGMQLYKGDSADGKIDWQDPKPVENIKAFGENVLGKALFDGHCARCHGLINTGTGPALIGVRNRGPWKDRQKLYAWTHNPTGFMTTDKYTQYLKCKYGVMMQAFPALSNEALDSIYKYVDEEAERLGLNGEPGMTGSDSCAEMQQMYDSLLNKRNEIAISNNGTIDIEYNLPVKKNPPPTVDFLEQKTDYYKVNIDATGWYNVDVLLEMKTGVVKSKLIVKLQGIYADKQEIYFAIPSMKVISQGGYLKEGSDIGFADLDGSIPLPQQTQALVFAVGEQKGKFYFSKKDFITSKNQTITLTAYELSREAFDQEMAQIDRYGFTTTVDTTTHFSSLKSVDERLEKIKNDLRKNCGCDTPQPTDNTTRDTISSLQNRPDNRTQ